MTFRPLTRADLPMLHGWLQRPHVAEWWHEPTTLAELEDDYLSAAALAASTRAYIALLDGEPLGFIQSYVALGSSAAGGKAKPTRGREASINSSPTAPGSAAASAARWSMPSRSSCSTTPPSPGSRPTRARQRTRDPLLPSCRLRRSRRDRHANGPALLMVRARP
jgi:hypothetical protein